MYFPYLRGKQFEVTALKELVPLLAQSEYVIPILEPVRKAAGSLDKIARVTADIGSMVIIIENPEKGDFGGDHRPIRQLFSGPLSHLPSAVPGFIVDSKTTLPSLRAFFARHSDRSVVIFHFGSLPRPDDLLSLQEEYENTAYNVFLDGKVSRSYRTSFKTSNAVVLEDKFTRQAVNKDYPPREFFSDRHRLYREDGFAGFGDFLVIGNHYADGGGAAHAVAIHLTNREDGGDIYIRHFVSDRTKGTADTPGKFMEALRKASRFIMSNENWRRTQGCEELLDLGRRQHFPGLGYVKKISIKHHIELLDQILIEAG